MELNVVFGTLAALFSPLLMAIGFTLWDKYSPFHPYVLNTVKCSFAAILFGITVAIIISTGLDIVVDDSGNTTSAINQTIGVSLPVAETPLFSVSMLVLSGLVGIVLGDNAWLYALKLIGARRVILVDSIKPFAAALAAWPTLGEPVKPIAFLGMAITMTSIVVVSLENEKLHDAATALEVNAENSQNSSVKKVLQGNRHDEQSNLESFHGSISSQVCENDSSTDEETLRSETSDKVRIHSNTRQEEEHMMHSDCAVDSCQDTMRPTQENTLVVLDEEEVSGNTVIIARKASRFTPNQVGYLWSALNVILDVFGSILTKRFGTSFNSFEIGGIRFGSSAIVLAVGIVLFRTARRIQTGTRHPMVVKGSLESTWWQFAINDNRSLIFVIGGVVVTTYMCPSMQNYAIFQLPISTYSTLQAMTPIWSIPVVYLLKDEKTSLKALLGSVCAILGIIPLYVA